MAEKEYIEREALLQHLNDEVGCFDRVCADYLPIEYGVKLGLRGAISFANTLPAADVAEVVRCKDCKNAYINSFSAQSGVALCRFWSKRSNGELLIFQQDDFCSYGERKEATP